MFSYRYLLRQAWQITWRHKYLWFFGLFASLAAAGGSIEYQVVAQNLNQNLIDGSYAYFNNILAISELIKNLCLGLTNLFQYNFWTILNALTLILLALLVIAIFVWLAITSQAALINEVKKITNAKKKNSLLDIRSGLTIGHQNFWPVLGLNILIRILVNFAFFIISLPLIFVMSSDATVLKVVYTILFVIFIPLAVSLSLMLKYAIAYKVLEKKSFIVSIENGWKLFIKNWLISLEMAIILFIINFLVGLGILLVLAILLFPLFFLGIAYQIYWLMVLMVLLGLIIIIFVGSGLTTFQIATWTNLFIRLKEKGGLAKLERLFLKK
ncbi:MAG: hypothetical protein WC523_06525 [Patescibacteria group bacterium]|jgi:hypothetical protein